MVYIKIIARFGAGVGHTYLGVLHHRRDGRMNLDKTEFIAGGEYAFAVYANDVITHHLARFYLAQWCQLLAHKVYIFRTTHLFDLRFTICDLRITIGRRGMIIIIDC